MYFSPSTGGFYHPEIHGDGIPGDAVQITAEEHTALLDGQSQGLVIQVGSGGRPVLAVPVKPPLTQAQYTAAIDAHVEATARGWQYKSAAHLASYAASTVPQWQADALAFIAWRDAVWLASLARFAAIEAGTFPPPESTAAWVASLPVIVRP